MASSKCRILGGCNHNAQSNTDGRQSLNKIPRGIQTTTLLVTEWSNGRTIPKMIDIELNLNKTLNNIQADPTRMEQVLMNCAVMDAA